MAENNETLPSAPKEGPFPPVIAIISIITIIGNLLVIVTLCKKPRSELRIVYNYLVLNLATADLMVGLVGEPLWISLYWVDDDDGVSLVMSNPPSAFNITSRSVLVIAATASRCTLLFITLERYVALEMPLRREKLFSGIALKFYILLIWLYALVTTLLTSFHDIEAFRLVLYPLAQFELVVIFVLYMRMFIIIRKFNEAQLANRVREPLIQTGHAYRLARKRECSLAKDMFFLVGAYVLCFLPLSITRSVECFASERVKITFNTAELLKIIYVSKCAIDPVLYTFIIRSYRWQVKRLFYKVTKAFAEILFTSNGAVNVQ